MMMALDKIVLDIKKIKENDTSSKIYYPMLILRSKKGWTGPSDVNE